MQTRESFERLRVNLELERNDFLVTWKDLGENILPMRPRFAMDDKNRGRRRNQKIIDSSATLASRTQSAGMVSGITSPARPWFRLSVPEPELRELGPVKTWLSKVTGVMSDIFNKTNLYNVLAQTYADLGTFGTAAIFMEEDFEEVMRFYAIPIGSFYIANNDRHQVEVFMREFKMTARQIVDKFGRTKPNSNEIEWTTISTNVKDAWDNKRTEQYFDIVHGIQRNENYDPKKSVAKFKKYISVYYEKANNEDKLLSEKGYDFFPVLAPRWGTSGGDVYGTDCPGMVALGDIRQLQHGEKFKGEAVEKMVRPPMVAPASMERKKTSILPGDVTYVDSTANSKFEPAMNVNFQIMPLSEMQREVRLRIQRAYYEDLFLMLAQSDRRQITAREIEERHEEKLLALGPVLEQLNQDLLDRLINAAFMILFRQELIPKPPEELQGREIKIEYISIMAEAQKLIGLAGIERFASFATQVIATNPESLDKIDTDQLLDIYGDLTSIPPGILRTDDDVAKMRASRAEAQQAQAQIESLNSMSGTAKNLSQASMDGNNALSQLMGTPA